MRPLKEEGMDSGFMGMLSEDHSAPANLPQKVVHKYYPKNKMDGSWELDDTIRGVDDNFRDAERKMDEHQSDSMY